MANLTKFTEHCTLSLYVCVCECVYVCVYPFEYSADCEKFYAYLYRQKYKISTRIERKEEPANETKTPNNKKTETQQWFKNTWMCVFFSFHFNDKMLSWLYGYGVHNAPCLGLVCHYHFRPVLFSNTHTLRRDEKPTQVNEWVTDLKCTNFFSLPSLEIKRKKWILTNALIKFLYFFPRPSRKPFTTHTHPQPRCSTPQK